MRFDSTVAPVPRVDRAIGALVTLAAATLAAYVLVVLLVPDASTASTLLTVAVAVVAGSSVTAWLLLDGYDRFRVPLEGRRWAVELVAFAAMFAAAQVLVDAIAALPPWVVFAAALAALYVSSLVGNTVADARNWYDDDAYYRET